MLRLAAKAPRGELPRKLEGDTTRQTPQSREPCRLHRIRLVCALYAAPA